MKTIFFLSLFFILSSCSSKKEQEERRENSFDISGSYKSLVSQGSELDFGFEIKNESGRHDIMAVLTRNSDLTQKEKDLLAQNSIDGARVLNFFTANNILGQGYDPNRADGGENISKDFGESSEFSICSIYMEYNNEYRIQYCLNGKIKKSENFLKGYLTLRLNRTQSVVENGQTTTKLTISESQIEYRSKTDMVFYKQYLGTWSGEIFDVEAEFKLFTPQLQFLQIVEIPESASYMFVPPGLSSFNYKGQTFQFNSALSTVPTSILQTQDFPDFKLIFTSSDQRRILFVGQIWSLGNLTGTILWIDEKTQVPLGHLRYKKN